MRRYAGYALNPRESMLSLPAWIQPFLTWCTGRHHGALPPEPKRSPAFRLFTSTSELAWGVVISVMGMYWVEALIPIGWLFTVGGARTLQVTICHHLVHGTFFRDPKHRQWNRRLYQAISTVLFIQDYDGYKEDHVRKHHHDTCGPKDPDQVFLYCLGFRPGISKAMLWRTLFQTLFSPRFHWLFLKARWKANSHAQSLYRRLTSVLYLTLVLSTTALTGFWWPLIVAWLVPMTFLYHMSALLQFTSEHLWFAPQAPSEAKRLRLGRLTAGRFSGNPVPSPGLSLWKSFSAWTRWTVGLFLYHLPVRVAVLVGDISDHDLHHRAPGHDWANSRSERLAYISAGQPSWPEPLVEIWGLGAALEWVFDHLTQLPEAEVEARIGQIEKDSFNQGLLSM